MDIGRDNPPGPSPVSPSLADALVTMLDGFTQLLEAVVGYRAKLEEAGFSPTAEKMAEEFHQHLLRSAFTAAAK